MAVTGKPRTGKGGRCTIANTIVKHITASTITPHVADCDVSCVEGNGYEEHAGDIVGASVELSLNWNSAQNYYDMGLVAGGFVTNVLIYISVSDNLFWTFAQLFITSPPMRIQLRQATTVTISAVTDGPFTYPAGSV